MEVKNLLMASSHFSDIFLICSDPAPATPRGALSLDDLVEEVFAREEEKKKSKRPQASAEPKGDLTIKGNMF